MRQFVGRGGLLARIDAAWKQARESGQARMITIGGRRRVGKSWLVEEFIDQSRAPNLFFTASRQTEERELGLFASALAGSSLPSRQEAAGVAFAAWQEALVAAGGRSDPKRPSVIVLDDFPSLLGATEQSRDAVLGAVHAAWDRTLSRKPVLLILVGSDQAMMGRITAPRQPPLLRPALEILVPPLDPAEAAALSGLTGADALDSYLVTGGFPRLVRARIGRSLRDFLADQLTDDGNALVTTGRLVLDAEAGSSTQARTILSVIGEGHRKRVDIANRVGVAANNLKPPLDLLTAGTRVVEARRPLSSASSRDTRYEIVDPYLRFYTRFIDRSRGEIERGRGRIVADRILRDWQPYRDQAIKALVRESIAGLLPDTRLGKAAVVGAYWTTDDEAEIDLVGADRPDPPAKSLAFIGTVRWHDDRPVDMSDHDALVARGSRLPGVGPATLKVAVSRLGADAQASTAFDLVLDAGDVLAAWSVR